MGVSLKNLKEFMIYIKTFTYTYIFTHPSTDTDLHIFYILNLYASVYNYLYLHAQSLYSRILFYYCHAQLCPWIDYISRSAMNSVRESGVSKGQRQRTAEQSPSGRTRLSRRSEERRQSQPSSQPAQSQPFVGISVFKYLPLWLALKDRQWGN
jgi:hypothetical protein